MHPGPQRRQAFAALIPATVLALVLGIYLAWTALGNEEPGAPQQTAPPPLAEAPGLQRELGRPEEGSAPRTAELLAPEASATNDAAVEASLRLRFLRGSSGLPAAGLRVWLLPRLDDGAEWVVDDWGPALAQGATDAQGFLEVPSNLREQGFEILLEPDGKVARTARPRSLLPGQLEHRAQTAEIEVLAAWATIEALVLGADGRPVAGALVQFDFESPSLAFSTRDAPSTRVESDSDGLARFALLDPASVGGRMHVKADLQGEWHSQVVELAPPLGSKRVELQLATTASAKLRVEDAAGTPLQGVMARLERLEAPFASVGRSTDRDGEAAFRPLEPGLYAASAEDPATGATARSEFVIAQCQMAELALVLPPSEHPLAVAGSVRGVDGRPVTWLSVSICVEGREEARLATDAQGRFRYHRAPCESLRVRLKAPFDGPQVDPEVVDAPFGSSGLEFVLGDAPRFGYLALRVVDRASAAPLGSVAAVVFRDSSAERVSGVVSALASSPMYLASNESGLLYVPSGAQLPRAHLVVEKRGYVRRELDLDELARLPVLDGHAILELDRGYLHRWVVLDARTRRPVPGAVASQAVDPLSGRVLDDGSPWQPSAPSDARGVIELALPQAPSRVSIQAPGYRPRSLQVAQAPLGLDAGVTLGDAVLLEALDGGR